MTEIVRAFVAVIRTRRRISDGKMAASPGAVALIVRAFVSVIGTDGARRLGICATEPFTIACIRTIAGGIG